MFTRGLQAAAALAFGLVKRFPIWTAIGVFALGGYLLRDVLSGSVEDLKVGDCFDVPIGTTLVKDVQHHRCTDAHDAEMVFVGFMPGTRDAYPAEADFLHFVQVVCIPEYETYTGRSYKSDPTYDMNYFAPSPDGWKNGDQGMNCFVVRADGKQLTAPVRVAH